MDRDVVYPAALLHAEYRAGFLNKSGEHTSKLQPKAHSRILASYFPQNAILKLRGSFGAHRKDPKPLS